MEYRNWNQKDGTGRSISTSLLGYGCMRFPTLPDGSIDEVRAEKLLNTAREAGVNYFDTAFPYHGGASEPFVGRVIAKWPRESFYLATKLPVWNCKTLDEAKAIFEQQFQRLGVDYIDFYLLHSLHKARYDAAKEMGIVDWLWEQKAAGRIRSFGFSCHDNAAGFEHILRDQPWDFCQLQYNYLDTDDRAEEIAGDRGYALTEERNVPLIIMEPIKGGTLAQLPPDAAAPLRALDPAASAASWALRHQGRLHRLPLLYALPDGGGHPGQFQHLEQTGDVRPEGRHPSAVDGPLPRRRKGQPLCPLRQMRGRLSPAPAHPGLPRKASDRAGQLITKERRSACPERRQNAFLFSPR